MEKDSQIKKDGEKEQEENPIVERVFLNNDFLEFLRKKTERVSAAVHLITASLKDTDPIKNILRSHALSLLDKNLLFLSKDIPVSLFSLEEFIVESKRLVSLLCSASLGGLISQMNFSVLEREVHNLIFSLQNKSLTPKKGSLSLIKEFFEPEKSRLAMKEQDKRQIFLRDKNSGYLHAGQLTGDQNIKGQSMPEKKKESRRSSIMSMLQSKNSLTVRDFLGSIKDCSPKTIQRELLDMVKEGVLKKEGEKRWSRYSLAIRE